MTTAYIAGPMRGQPEFGFPVFDECAAYLRQMDWTVFSPAEHDRSMGFDEKKGMPFNTENGYDLKAAFAWDCQRVCEVDFVVLLPGWEQSQGVNAELTVAKMVGTPLCYYDPTAPRGARIFRDETEMHRRHVQRYFEPKGADEGVKIEKLLPEQFQVVSGPHHTDGEVRSVNATTGAEKGVKLARYDLVPAGPLDQLAEHYGRGARKYADRNWEKGYEWSKSYAALMRHANLFWRGEDIDPETGSPHMVAVAWHAFALLEWATTHPELDDRP